MTPEREALVTDIAAALAARGVTALVLRGPNPDPGVARDLTDRGGDDMVLLVRQADAPAARRVLQGTAWRFELGGRWPWRIFHTVSYLYDDRLGIDLMWGVPAAPVPFRRLRALERSIWSGATLSANGLAAPRPEVLLVFLATVSARLGLRSGRRHHVEWSRDLAACAAAVGDWGRVWSEARDAGAQEALRRGLALAEIQPPEGPPDATGGPVERAMWSAAGFVQRHARPRRFRAYAAAVPRLGRTTARVNFAGVVVEVGRKVFVPRGLAETLVEESVKALPADRRGVAVDVGTGCGAVALALAAAAPELEIHATELSRRAVLWANRNKRRLGSGRVRFHRGSLLDPLPDRLEGRVHVMTANVPYVPLEEWQDGWKGIASQVVGSDDDGLGLYRSLAREARRFLVPGGRFVMQLEDHQWSTFAEELRALGYVPGTIVRRWGRDVIAWAEAPATGASVAG